MSALGITALIVFLLLVLCLIAWHSDRNDWNDGICRRCARRWVHFDTDSQGGRGYKCEGGHTIWISWPYVD